MNKSKDFIVFLTKKKITESDDAYIASRLVKFCESEVQHISSCPECYEMKYTRPNEWRTLACSKPHLLLWVKLDHEIKSPDWQSKIGHSFWPAKLLSIEINSFGIEMVNAIFFCHSHLVEIAPANCFIYNKRPSTQTRRSKDIEDPQKVRKQLRFSKFEFFKLNFKTFELGG